MDSARLILLLIVGAANVLLALAVYYRDPKNHTNRSLAAAILTSVLWLAFAFLSDQPRFQDQALLLNRLTLAAAVVMGTLLVDFELAFPTQKEPIGPWGKAFLASGGVLALVTAATPLVVDGVSFASTGTDVIPGPGFVVFTLWVLLGIAVSAILLAGKYRVAHGRERAQIKYLLLGIISFTVLSALFGLVIPTITGSYSIAVLNTFTPLLLFGFTSYAMIKHRLLDMRVVVMRGAVYTILVGAMALCFMLVAQLLRSSLLSSYGIGGDAAFVLLGLAAVFAFQPLRRLVENVTERVFFRRHLGEQALLEQLPLDLVSASTPARVAELASEALSEQLKSRFVVMVHEEAGAFVVYGDGILADDPALADLVSASTDGGILLSEDVEDSNVAELLSDRRIRVVVPLSTDGGAPAALLLGEKRSGEVYTAHDVRFLQLVTPDITIALKTADLFVQRDQRVRELSALTQLASVLGEDIQFDALLNRALAEAIKVVDADGGSIMLLEPGTQILGVGVAQGLSSDLVQNTHVAMGERIVGWVAENRTALLMLDDGSKFTSELKRNGMKSALSVPLVSHERTIGVLNLSRSVSALPFTQQNLTVITSFAGQLAVAIDNAQLYRDLEGHVLGTITALAAAVEAKDPYTYGHSGQVTDLTLAIAAEMDLDEDETELLRKAALLHDIGKIGVDGAILNKTGPLDEAEFREIKHHPEIAANILASLDFLEDIVPLVLHHHERWDGKGYPAGIAGTDIPLGARIICVADSYDAMTSDRTYRLGMPRAKALAELARNAGTQFDPDVVAAYLRVATNEDQTRALAKARIRDRARIQ